MKWIIYILLIIFIFLTVYQCLLKYMSILHRQLFYDQQVPEWLSNSPILMERLQKKMIRKVNWQDVGLYLLCHMGYERCNQKGLSTWKEFEEACEPFIQFVHTSGTQAIVGILSGGAFIAQYISFRTGAPVKFIQIHKYNTIHSALFAKNLKVIAISSDMVSLKNKKILIVDDLMTTGATLDNAIISIREYHPSHIYIGLLYLNSQKALPSGLEIDFVANRTWVCKTPWGYNP